MKYHFSRAMLQYKNNDMTEFRANSFSLSNNSGRTLSILYLTNCSESESGRRFYTAPHWGRAIGGGGIRVGSPHSKSCIRVRRFLLFLDSTRFPRGILNVNTQKHAYVYGVFTCSCIPHVSCTCSTLKAHNPGPPPGNRACWGIMKNDEVPFFPRNTAVQEQ